MGREVGRAINRLTTRQVAGKLAPGRYADGNGLYLLVDPDESRRWVFFFNRDGRRREMGLGSAKDVTLPKAREKALEARKLVQAGLDPIEEKRRPAPAASPPLADFAEEVIASLESGWVGAKTADGWRRTFTLYGKAIAQVPVDQIETRHVRLVLDPIWAKRSTAAGKVREHLERVLDAAKAAGHIAPPWENPARWKGHLSHLLPARPKLARGHHRAMPYAEVPAFLKRLTERHGLWARALELTIYTASRENMTLGARWQEFDLDAALWTVPADRMKGRKGKRKEFRIPLSPQALAVLQAVKPPAHHADDFVFPGQRPGRPLSNAAMDQGLTKMKVDAVPHGFRTSFRDWVEEQTTFPRELAERALAHVVGDETERAYLRGDVLEKRRALMIAWARYCAGETAKVRRLVS